MAHDKPEPAQTPDGEPSVINAAVARELGELARHLEAESDPLSVMQRIVRAAVEEIPGAAGAGITLREKGRVSSPVHSDERAERVSLAENDFGEGPCIDASRDAVLLRSDDLRHDERWPRWAPVAVENGILSSMSFQLFVEGDTMGALDVWGDDPNSFDAEAENIGMLLAAHAAVAMSGTRKLAQMRIAVDNRDVIGQAKGILMERFKIKADQAFDLLVMTSQRTHCKLRDVAIQLAETGELSLPPQKPGH